MTPEQRLQIIASVIRERGHFAMGPTEGRALELLLARVPGLSPAPEREDRLDELVSALAAAGWALSRKA